MKRPSILVTGSSGLIGSTVCQHCHDRGWDVHGIDNNQLAVFFGPLGDTRAVQRKLVESLPRFRHRECDIRDRDGVANLVRTVTPAAILEAFKIVSGLPGKDINWTYCEEARKGDHICYYTDLRKIRADYPGSAPAISLSDTISQIISELRSRS